MKRKKSKPKKVKEEPVPEAEPPREFCDWWYPTGIEQPSGASVGGHPDAERVWARKDPGRWSRRTFGMSVACAWATEHYREQFRLAQDAALEQEPFVSIVLPINEQAQKWSALRSMLKQIVKKVPATHYDVTNPRRGDIEQKVLEGEFVKIDENEPIDFDERGRPDLA
jgi:hypothetical protein